MKNKLRLVLPLLLSGYLLGCDNVTTPISEQDLKTDLVHLNQLLRAASSGEATDVVWPYSDGYLKTRHELYALLAKHYQTSEISYLQISERFPQRFLPWPIQSDLVETLRHLSPDEQDNWFDFVSKRLNEAAESKIRLTQFEREELVRSLTSFSNQSAAAKALLSQLENYVPRTRLGMDQLPNGSEWYQSKLNYFADAVNKPLDWMQIVSIKLTDERKVAAIELNYANWNTSIVEQFVLGQCEPVSGFDWQFHYYNISETVKRCSLSLDSDVGYFWATLMMLDLGLHYQGWNQQLAEAFLTARLDVDEETKVNIIRQVSLYPASVFALMDKI